MEYVKSGMVATVTLPVNSRKVKTLPVQIHMHKSNVQIQKFPSTFLSFVAPNRISICLRETQVPSVQTPYFLPSPDHALWSVTPSLHPDSRSHTRATFLPCSCWEDVSLWLKALWEIPTARPFRGCADVNV